MALSRASLGETGKGISSRGCSVYKGPDFDTFICQRPQPLSICPSLRVHASLPSQAWQGQLTTGAGPGGTHQPLLVSFSSAHNFVNVLSTSPVTPSEHVNCSPPGPRPTSPTVWIHLLNHGEEKDASLEFVECPHQARHFGCVISLDPHKQSCDTSVISPF